MNDSDKNIFDDEDLLRVYDRILPLAKHYQSILAIHLRALEHCDNVIDLGCGTGNLAIELLKAGKSVTGVDNSLLSLNVLQRKANHLSLSDKLTLVHGDVTSLLRFPDAGFDGASSMIIAHLLDNPEAHFRESHRILNHGGCFVLTARGSVPQDCLAEVVRSQILAKDDSGSLRDDCDYLCNKLLLTAKLRAKHLFMASEIAKYLDAVGYVGIESLHNDSENVMVSLQASKHK